MLIPNQIHKHQVTLFEKRDEVRENAEVSGKNMFHDEEIMGGQHRFNIACYKRMWGSIKIKFKIVFTLKDYSSFAKTKLPPSLVVPKTTFLMNKSFSFFYRA